MLDCTSSFKRTFVKTVLTLSSVSETAEECKKLYGPPQVTFVADVSGSMSPNMTVLKNSVLALIDMAGEGGVLRVLTFDDTTRIIINSVILTRENTADLKEKIKTDLINYGRSTNLQEAIKYCLSDSQETTSRQDTTSNQDTTSSNPFPTSQSESIDPHQPTQPAGGVSDPQSQHESMDAEYKQGWYPSILKGTGFPKQSEETEQITLFASDGLANSGLTTSPELLTFARSFESYSKQTFFTLGIKLDPYVELNSGLLKDMALDSGGSFKVTSNSEGIAEILGDVLAHHYFVRFAQMSFRCESQNGHIGTLCTKLSRRGGILRADKPLELIWEFPCEALPPFTLNLNMKKRQTLENIKLNQIYSADILLNTVPCKEDDIEKIFGCCLLVPAIDRIFSIEELHLKISQLDLFMHEHLPSFRGVLHYVKDELQKCLKNFGHVGEQNAEDSMHSYAMSSGGGAVMSVQVEQLRISALHATQAQDSDTFDSQKTVESESNKRHKKN